MSQDFAGTPTSNCRTRLGREARKPSSFKGRGLRALRWACAVAVASLMLGCGSRPKSEEPAVASSQKELFSNSVPWATWDANYEHKYADVNGDGKADLVGIGPANDIMVALSTGTSFAAGTVWRSWVRSYGTYLADVNGDGAADLIGRANSLIRVALSDGGSFASTLTTWGVLSVANDCQFADVNGDGKGDVIGVGPNGDVVVGLSTGTRFTAGAVWQNWISTYDHHFVDIDGDGKADIVGLDPNSRQIAVALSTGTSFGAASIWQQWPASYDVNFADVNGDRRADIIGVSGTDVQVSFSTGSSFASPTTWATWPSGFDHDFADFDGHGNADIVGVSGSVVRVGLTTGPSGAAPQPAGWISAFGGVGERGWSPSGVPSLAAKLDSPSGLALCPDGALYVSDTGNNRVVKFSGGQMTAVVAGQTTPNGRTFGNLLLNPRAETPIPLSDTVQNWIAISPAGRWTQVESGRGRPEPLDGEHYFQATPGATGEMYQDVDVSAYATAIDGWFQWFNFSALVRSLSEPGGTDAAEIIVEYRALDGSKLAIYDSGPVQNSAEWTMLRDTRVAPSGTRFIRVRLYSTRYAGSGNDAYYDGLLLRALPNPLGRIIADGGPAINATLSQPHGLACDTDGTLYIADTYNGLVRSVDSSGIIHTIAGRKTTDTTDVPLPPSIGDGDGLATNIPLRFPVSIALNRGVGNADASWLKLVVADLLAHKVRALTAAGDFKAVLSGNGAPCTSMFLPGTDGCAYYPAAVDAVGNMVGAPHFTIAQQGNYKILDNLLPSSASASGPVSYYAPLTAGTGFRDALGSTGVPLPNAPYSSSMRRPVAITSISADPSGMQGDPHLVRTQFVGDLKNTSESVPSIFVADLSNHAIRHVTFNGLVQTVAGNGTIGDSGDGGPATQALLAAPSALVQSKDGTLYVADTETNRIRKISCADVDLCTSGVARNGPSCTWTGAKPLYDGNPCTDDRCFWPIGAVHVAISQGASCRDGNPCNGDETCLSGVCTPGTPLTAGAQCSDGDACNGAETCAPDHTCRASTLPTIDDANPCTVDVCSTSGGVTNANVANGAACVSNDPCRNPGSCQNGACLTTSLALNTSNPCVTESCNSTTGVVRTFNTNPCSGGTCSSGACVPSLGFTSAGSLVSTFPPSPSAVFAGIYGPGGVQTGANPGTEPGQLDPKYATHLFGSVALSNPTDSVTDVKVVVLNHPESGQTFVRADGKFDIVANGGGPLVLRFTKQDYLPVDRRAAPVWGAGAHIDDVVMVKLDTVSTSVSLNSATYTEAVGSPISAADDPRGARTARLLFPPNTTATAVSSTGPGGTTTTLAGPITVRATEFTVGNSADALSRMPAPLPATTLYTYAVAYTVDQALGAASVVFNHPVFAYLENFVGTRTGDNVPSGYYDPDKAAWLPEDNGKALAVVGYDQNGARIDITGDGFETQADTDAWASTTPENQRLTADDRALIALRYPGGTQGSPKRIWRVPLTHFSIHDFNHGGGVECVGGKCPEFASTISGGDDAPKGGSCQRPGSIIGAEDQSLGEQLPVIGTPFALNYKSSYTLGYLPPRGVEVDYNPTSTTLDPKEFRVSLATSGGFWKQIRPALRQNYIAWDGLDGSGRRVNGSQVATIQATQVYSGSYKVTGRFGDAASSDEISQGYPVVAGSPPDVYYTRTFTRTLSAWGADALGLGGWTLSSMHVYDPSSGILYQGDGVQRRNFGDRILRLIAGNGTQTSAPTGTLAVNSGIPGKNGDPAAAVASNGDVYLLVWDDAGRVLRKIVAATGAIVDVMTLTENWVANDTGTSSVMALSPDQQSLYVPMEGRLVRIDLQAKQASVFAGTGSLSHIDGPASSATFGDLRGVAVAQDGTVYVADGKMVRKIAPDSARTVSTIAGSDSATLFCPNGNGQPAKKLRLHGAGGFGISVAPDGTLWIGSGYDLVQVDAAGLAWCHSMPLGEVGGSVAVGTDNTVYFSRYEGLVTPYLSAYSLRTLNSASKSTVASDSETTIVAGGKGVLGEPRDGAPATSTPIALVQWMSAGPDGSLYFMNRYYVGPSTWSTRIYQLTPPPKTNAPHCAIALPSEDGSQKFCFDKNGRHLNTRNARTDEPLLAFAYGADGLLTAVLDVVDQNVTTISRTPDLVTITGPFGQTTKIGLDTATHYAKYIEDATGQRTNVTHDGSGLLLSLTDRNGKPHSFAYDSLGRLQRDSDPVGFQSLFRIATADGVPVVQSTDPISSPISASTPTAANGYSVSDATAMGAVRSFAVTVDSAGIEKRTVTLADGGQNLSTRSSDGSVVTRFADRRVVTSTSAFDPVTAQPYNNSAKTIFPNGTPPSSVARSKTFSGSVWLDKLTLNGAPWTKSFDSSTKTYTITSPMGRTSTIAVDAHDRPLVAVAPGIGQTMYHYDHGRLDSMSQGTRQTQLFYYPAATNTPGLLQRIKVTDDSGPITTLLVPDQAGRPLTSTTCAMNASETACESAAAVTGMSWDFEGNLTSVTPPGQGAHGQTFTGTNLLQSYSTPSVQGLSGDKTSFTYNRDGALEYVQQPANRYIDYIVEPATGRLLADGNAEFVYYPSSTDPRWTKGQLQTAKTGVVLQTFTYDGPLPATESMAWLSGGASASVARNFNADLRLQTEAVSISPTTGGTNATIATYAYDLDGLVTCASLSSCGEGAVNRLALSYNETTGLPIGTTIGSTPSTTVSDTYTWNAYGELASYSAKIGTSSIPFYSVTYDDQVAHVRDGFGRVKWETDQAGNVRQYTYDVQGRLNTISDESVLKRRYTYDLNGNRLSSSPNSTTPIAVYDGQDRLISYEGTTYKYWPNGELRSKATVDGGVVEYNYSPLGYLTGGVLSSGVAYSYAYDGFGRRIQKVLGATTTRYVYRDGLHPVAVLDGSGALIARFVYGSRPNVPDLMVQGDGTVFRIISDQLGSPRVVVSLSGVSAGTIVRRIDYDEFGTQTVSADTGALADQALPLGFAGGLYDPDTGFVRFGARDYEPAVGRWISKDPILFGGQQSNLYVYVKDDPVNWLDPVGLWGVGPIVAGSAEAGASVVGAGAQVAAGFGAFWGGPSGFNTGFFASGGIFGGTPTGGVCSPTRPGPGGSLHVISGAYAGWGEGAFITNANSVKDLGGYFDNVSLNLPWFSLNFGFGGGTYVLAVTGGPWSTPTADASFYGTNTATRP